MKRLILIRHAKSSWDAPFDDHARTLDARGRDAASRIGGWLAAQEYRPDVVYSSDAARTQETTDRIVAELGTPPNVTLLDTLYHASTARLMKTLKAAQRDTIAIVAHNPGISIFAEDIVAAKPKHPKFLMYPTGATLICDFDIQSWKEAKPRSGKVVDFIVPKDLTD